MSLIRYQALNAIDLSHQPPPLGGMAINGLHDAVEAFLRLCVGHLPAAVTKNSDFIQVFDAVDKHPSVDGALAEHRARLLALNQARIGFKHHGNLPTRPCSSVLGSTPQDFLEQACQVVLRQRLDEVSLTAFIRDQTARQRVEAADAAWTDGHVEEAMASLREAFDRPVEDYEQRKVWYQGRSLFTTKPSFAPSKFDLRGSGRELEKLVEWLEALERQTTLLAVGVDLRRYAYLDAHAPHVHIMLGSRERHIESLPAGVMITEDVFRRCYRFVVDTAIALGAEDYDYDAWETARTARRLQRGASQEQGRPEQAARRAPEHSSTRMRTRAGR